MPKPIEVKALANYRIWLRYDDGTEGKVDLSDLAGRGVFKASDDLGFAGVLQKELITDPQFEPWTRGRATVSEI